MYVFKNSKQRVVTEPDSELNNYDVNLVSLSLPVCLSVCLPVCLSVCLCLSLSLSVYLSLSVCLSVCLSLALFVSLSLSPPDPRFIVTKTLKRCSGVKVVLRFPRSVFICVLVMQDLVWVFRSGHFHSAMPLISTLFLYIHITQLFFFLIIFSFAKCRITYSI